MTPGSSTPIIEVIISPTGATTLQSKGFAGPSCRQATRALEQALGLVASDTPTAEMHQVASQQSSNPQRIG
jgi:hypothetical protein